MRTTQTALSLLLLTLFCACGGGELVGVHVALDQDGSGTVTVRALAPTTTAPKAAAAARGAEWQVHAELVSSQGTFQKIQDLDLGDGGVTFSPQLDGDRPGLRVRLRRGADAAWVSQLTPARAERQALAKAYDPTGRTGEVGDVIRLEVRAPGRVLASGVLPTGRGVEADRDGDKAVLLLPARTLRTDKDGDGDFVWDISWLK